MPLPLTNAFYERMGAKMLMDWRTMRVTGEALPVLATQGKWCCFRVRS
jgi:hypothetical protein